MNLIYGIIAAADEFVQSGQPSAQSLGQFDFIGGTYSWGGTSLAASDVTDKTAWIGASGLAVPGSQSAGAQLLYSPITTLMATCNFSGVFEVETLSTAWAEIFSVLNAGGLYYTELKIRAENWWELGDYGGVTRAAADDVNGLTIGVHKVSFTQTSGRLSLSVDGSAIVTDITDISGSPLPVPGFPMTKFYLGGWDDATDAAINIRSMSFYNALSDDWLPSLSV